MKRNLIHSAAILITIAFAGCARQPSPGTAPSARVAIEVTEKGFEPEIVTVPANQPVTLVVTRTTDHTCATDFVMSDRNIKRELPLNRAVEIALGPEKPGKLRYACAMDMFRGTVEVK